MSNQLPNLDAYWMPFTGNRYFKKNPRLFKKARGVFYTTHEDQELLDGVSGLWCCNAGHCHPRILNVLKDQAEILTLTSRAFYNNILGKYEEYKG